MTTLRGTLGAAGLAVLLAVGLVGCSDDSPESADATTSTTEAEAAASTTTTTEAVAPLDILVTNDDGVAAEGIDELVVALRELPAVTVTVVAPADQRSGTGGKTTPGQLVSRPATTASGIEATAIEGFPADTVIWALDQGGLPTRPHVVVSGSNEGQNLGPIANISGTVGAARAAASRGIPALAVSQGAGAAIDYSSSVEFAIDWVVEHRAELAAGTAPATVTSINSPTCGTGAVKGIVEVPPATEVEGRSPLTADVDCAADTPQGADDVDAFNAGYATLTDVPVAAG